MALTAAARHLGPQLSPLISRTLPDVAPPTTWVARMSFYPPKQRMRCVSGFAFSQPARRHSLPNRVRFTAHRQFASGCSPPRFAATQLPSATGPWLTPTWTLTMLCTRLHGRTGSPPLWAIASTPPEQAIAHGVGSYKDTDNSRCLHGPCFCWPCGYFVFVGAHPCGRWFQGRVPRASPTGWAPTKIQTTACGLVNRSI
jgi:hypothetical protein